MVPSETLNDDTSDNCIKVSLFLRKCVVTKILYPYLFY